MIGIIGGVGPFAGIDLLGKVYRNTLAGKDQEHLDTLLLSLSSKIDDRTEYLEGRVKQNPGIALAEVIGRLYNAGARVAGIPCNTAHSPVIFKKISELLEKREIRIKLLHMIDETVDFIAQKHPGLNRIGILSTTGTYKSGIYDEKLIARGYRVIKPDLKKQEEIIHQAIYHTEYGIKSTSENIHPQARENLLKGLEFLKDNKAEAVILGCTEIPLAIRERQIYGMITLDPTGILARALIREHTPEKLKPLAYDTI